MTGFEDFFATIRAAADPERASQMSAYMRDQFPFLGVPTPRRQTLVKPYLATLSRTELDPALVLACWEQPEREFQYIAVDYLAKIQNHLQPSHLDLIHHLALTKSWWDTIDGLDRIVGTMVAGHPQLRPTILQWSIDPNIWLRRIAIDHQLQRRQATDTRLLHDVLVNNLNQTEFFINKAMGWALRDYAKTNPTWVLSFIDQYRDGLSKLSVREATKHIGTQTTTLTD